MLLKHRKQDFESPVCHLALTQDCECLFKEVILTRHDAFAFALAVVLAFVFNLSINQ